MDKQQIRERIWQQLIEERAARFPPPFGRIPNFNGAEEAASRLASHPIWRRTKVVKMNPDSPQRPLRELALQEGKTLVMARPRLRQERCFLLLTPEIVRGRVREASTIQGAERFGRPLKPEEVPPIDLIVCGCVAIRRDGRRIGKGEGYSELEFAILRHHGRLTETVPIATTIHPLQLVDDDFARAPFDFTVDLIATPESLLEVPRRAPRPKGILWDHLTDEKIASIPALQPLRHEK